MKRFARAATYFTALVVAAAIVVVGLLSGACGASSSGGGPYRCERLGMCYDASGCRHTGDELVPGSCSASLRVGRCMPPHGSFDSAIYVYGPLYWFSTPDCAASFGAGWSYVAD
jgi:hypothetical protein